ncbi:MAG: hypothetical protein QM495_09450 [Lutibacter sp.]|uniref:hypothetical protein n=1 Tax=Lutibacter sp. TaxID=1925666 RepID=UPI00385FDB28
MKKTIILIASILFLWGCNKQYKLSKSFNCNPIKTVNKIEIKDFNNNFILTIPNNWKSKLYFSKYESEIFVADTLKQLTESFILSTSFNLGKVTLNKNFYQKTDSILVANNLELLKSGIDTYQSKQAYWYVAKGFKNKFTFHQFNLTSKRTENSYFNASVEIYGDKNVNERICEAISILQKVKFLQ